jgi:hypothetical protein
MIYPIYPNMATQKIMIQDGAPYVIIWSFKRINYTVTTFKYVEGGPDRKAPEVV